jgi:L-fuconate dehydratase
MTITKIIVRDKRFPLSNGTGSDAVHSAPQYAYAICELQTDTLITGTGLSFTLGHGNDLVCKAIEYLSDQLVGKEIEELMADFGSFYKSMADSPKYRWLGPHKGIIHLALASIVNACYDLWAKSRQVPLWKLLIELSPEQLVNTLDLSYLEDVMTRQEAIQIIKSQRVAITQEEALLKSGYKGYDTSFGWYSYDNATIRDNALKAIDKGFTALKLKVGSPEPNRDIERALLIRKTVGDGVTIMLDANQQWNLPQALNMCHALSAMNPYWIEEPTDPDDILAHQTLAKSIYPLKIALGEHVPNKVMFKNFLQAQAMSFNQVDAVRVGGISEFITISLLSKKFEIPVLPHVGDMGQLHQHLVLFNHIALGHEALFLEHIPHLTSYFKTPAQIHDGYYQVPQEVGSSCDIL